MSCLHHVQSSWPRTGVLRVEVVRDPPPDYSIDKSYEKEYSDDHAEWSLFSDAWPQKQAAAAADNDDGDGGTDAGDGVTAAANEVDKLADAPLGDVDADSGHSVDTEDTAGTEEDNGDELAELSVPTGGEQDRASDDDVDNGTVTQPKTIRASNLQLFRETLSEFEMLAKVGTLSCLPNRMYVVLLFGVLGRIEQFFNLSVIFFTVIIQNIHFK